MIKVLIGDIFESRAQTHVNTVNCVGVMGKGIALGFKTRYPDMFDDYVRRCAAGSVRLGRPYLYRRLMTPWILNFPTKDHWRSMAHLSSILEGLDYLEHHYRQWEITSLAVPPLGCGEGKLEWRVVGSSLYRSLSRLDVSVEMYAPFGTPDAELGADFLSQLASAGASYGHQRRIKPGMVAVVEVLARIEKEPYHWPIGRTIAQKIAYFATDAGLATGLTFSRGSYGPYASGLTASMTQLANNGLLDEERSGQMFVVKVGPTYDDARRAYSESLEEYAPIIDRLVDLFLRMRTTRQAEVAATVHIVATWLSEATGRQPDEQDVLQGVMEWKQRRQPPFDELEVATTIRTLAAMGWLAVRPSSDLRVTDEALMEV